ncbi:hypothetical protein QYF36_027134 [Acer negundo]|nr:hypothetical protein QYF36_027134 [Acer negundo]
MEKSRRSGDQSGVIVKNRSSSGCLIVRKKSEDASGAGSSGSRKVFQSKKEKKRPRMVMSDSGSSDELLKPPRRRVAPETIRVCNGLSVLEKGAEDECEFGRKRDRVERVRHNEDGLVGRNEDRKRNRLDVFEFDEYDGADMETRMRHDDLEDSRVDFGRRRFLGSTPLGKTGIEREFESSSSRHVIDKRKKLYFERTGSFNQGGPNRFGMDRDSGRIPIPLLREKYLGDSDEPIRLQGKNGVLKVMVNKKKKVAEPVKKYDRMDIEENRSASRAEDNVKRNISIPPPSYLETEVLEKPGSFVRTQKNQIKLKKSLSAKKSKDEDSDSDDSDTALKLGPKRMGDIRSTKEVSSESEKTPGGKLTLSRIKEGKVKRGSGTEKQKLRERIRGMLVDSGWKIDYRPRKNRDYLDAVYINPSGTAYWSIIKAYDALLKQLNEDEDEVKPSGDDSPFAPLPDEVLSQLTRKTRKKIEKEMKRKQKDGSQSGNAREAAARKSSSTRHAEESMDSHEEKLSSFLKQGGKSSKNRINENGVVGQNSKSQSSHDHDSERQSSAFVLHGRKSRKLGRCTLLVRGSNAGPNSESDGFVPYPGKLTLLSWLIDSGTVQLSQKVQYMNRRRTKVILEGWITREGIHCGCCSKILTVLKFEIHAGSKLRQPFQNIYLDTGVSLLQCQIDAWNKLQESQRIGFHFVDIDGDDPNDDTCGICGDGGDLICCDGCPSTFHQNCLSIQMLPPGDWHCPNCICKFCGAADVDVDEVDDPTASELPTCSMCEKKYHILCMQETDPLPADSNSSVPSFCGQKCRELFEQLQKYLGVKHELESGFSWSLIHRTDEDSDISLRGLPQRAECNSKLAVALTVMDECFLPIVDRRSGINLIHNVLYNSGSNFNRLNYSGFYTAILERGDEIISAASIRFHGTQLAEMPFIGTRHIYRRQGMCRRLFSALQSALCSFKVEKLIIPAIAELMHTWTAVFGFTKLEDSLKQEMRSLNMLVFPGIDMLQKLFLEHESIKENLSASGSKQRKLKVKHDNSPELANKSDIDSSAEHDTDECADGGRGLLHANDINGEVDGADNNAKSPGVSLNETPMHSGSLNASPHVSVEGAACAVSPVGDKLPESASDGKCHSNSDKNDVASKLENKPEPDSPVADISPSSEEGDMDVVHTIDVNVAASHEDETPISCQETRILDSESGNKLLESDSEKGLPVSEGLPITDMNHDATEQGNKPESPMHSGSLNSSPRISVEGAACAISPLGDKLPESASDGKCFSNSDKNDVASELENKPEPDSPVVDIFPSSEEGDMDVVHVIDVNVAASQEDETPISGEETRIPDSESGNKLLESDSDKKGLPIADMSLVATEQGNKPESPMHNGSLNASPRVSVEGEACDVSLLGDKLPESASDGKCLSNSDTNDVAFELENKPESDSPVADISPSSEEGDMDVVHAIDVNVAAPHEAGTPISGEETRIPDSESGNKLLESDSDKKGLPIAEMSNDAAEQGNKPESDSLIKDNDKFTTECDVDDADVVNANVAAPQEVNVAFSVVKICSDSRSGNQSAESAYDKNCLSVMHSSNDAIEMENSGSPVEDNTGSSEGDMDVSAAACCKVEIPVDGTICSGSKSGDKFIEIKNRPVLDSVEGGTQSQREGDTGDAYAIDDNIAAFHELKIPVSVAGSIISNSQSRDSASADSDSEKEHKPPLDSAVEDNTHPKPVLSSVQIIVENNTEVINENPVSSCVQITMDSDNQTSCEKGQEFSVTSEAGSEATSCEESCPQPGSDSIQGDTVEGKSGSSSI